MMQHGEKCVSILVFTGGGAKHLETSKILSGLNKFQSLFYWRGGLN